MTVYEPPSFMFNSGYKLPSKLNSVVVFVFLYGLKEERIGCINSDGPEFTIVRHTRFFNSLLCELVEILDTDECLSSPSSLIGQFFMSRWGELDSSSDCFDGVGEAALWCLWLWDCSPLVASIPLGLLAMGAILECSGGPRSGRGGRDFTMHWSNSRSHTTSRKGSV